MDGTDLPTPQNESPSNRSQSRLFQDRNVSSRDAIQALYSAANTYYHPPSRHPSRYTLPRAELALSDNPQPNNPRHLRILPGRVLPVPQAYERSSPRPTSSVPMDMKPRAPSTSRPSSAPRPRRDTGGGIEELGPLSIRESFHESVRQNSVSEDAERSLRLMGTETFSPLSVFALANNSRLGDDGLTPEPVRRVSNVSSTIPSGSVQSDSTNSRSQKKPKQTVTWDELLAVKNTSSAMAASRFARSAALGRSAVVPLHDNPWLLIRAYVRIRLFAKRWKRAHRIKDESVETDICAPLIQMDSTDWLHVFPVCEISVLDGLQSMIQASSFDGIFAEGNVHISKTHISIRVDEVGNTTDSMLFRLTDVTKINPSEDALQISFYRSPNTGISLLKSEEDAVVTIEFYTDECALIAMTIFQLQAQVLKDYARMLFTGLKAKSTRQLHIVHFNDVYHLPPFKPAGAAIVGGASRFHHVLAKIRETMNPLVLFSGDFMGPSLMSVITKGKQMVDAMNFLGVHYGCFGNHEFDFGLKTLKDVVHGYTQGTHIYPGSQTTWVMTNMTEADGKPLGGAHKYAVCMWSGIRVGIVGLCENWLPQCSQLRPGEAHYQDIFEEGEKYARMLKEEHGAEIVIALTHNRYNMDKEVTTNCPSIDYLLGGHDHFYKNDPKHRLIKSGQEFEYLTLLTANVAENEPLKVKVACHPITSQVPESAYMQGLIQRYDAKMNEKLGKTIGKSEYALDSTEECVRFREGRLTNFISDVMVLETGSDFAVLGGAAIAGKEEKPPGYITIGDVFGWFPNETRVMVMSLKGSTIKKMLDVMVRELPEEAPSYPHPSAELHFTINMLKKPCPEVESVYIGGEPLDDDVWYKAAVEDFVGKGKGKYKFVLEEGTVIISEEDSQQIVFWVLDFFQKRKGAIAAGSVMGKSTEEDTTLKTVSKVVSSATRIGVDMDMIKSQKFIRSLICELLRCDRSSVFLVDEKTDELYFTPDGAPSEIRMPKTAGMAGLCVKEGKLLNIPDVYDHPNFNRAIDQKTNYRTKSMLACPVILDGENVIAVVQAINKNPDESDGVFDQVDEMVLSLLGEQVGYQLLNRKLFMDANVDENVSHEALTVFRELSSDVQLETKTMLASLAGYANALIPCEKTIVYAYNEKTEEFIFLAEGLDDDDILSKRALEPRSVVMHTLMAGVPLCANDCSKSSTVTNDPDYQDMQWKRMYCEPVVSVRGRPLGVVVWINRKDEFEDVDLERGKYFAGFASISLQNTMSIEELKVGSNDANLQTVPHIDLNRIKVKGGWSTLKKYVKWAFNKAERKRRKEAGIEGLVLTLDAPVFENSVNQAPLTPMMQDLAAPHGAVFTELSHRKSMDDGFGGKESTSSRRGTTKQRPSAFAGSWNHPGKREKRGSKESDMASMANSYSSNSNRSSVGGGRGLSIDIPVVSWPAPAVADRMRSPVQDMPEILRQIPSEPRFSSMVEPSMTTNASVTGGTEYPDASITTPTLPPGGPLTE